MGRRFQFTLSKLFLLTTAVAVCAMAFKATQAGATFFGLSRVELAVVTLVAVLLFGDRFQLHPRNRRP